MSQKTVPGIDLPSKGWVEEKLEKFEKANRFGI